MTDHRYLQPEGWPRPRGYANGIAATGRLVMTAGVIGWTKDETFEANDFPGQFDQALSNVAEILRQGDAEPHHLVRLTCYVTDIAAYRASLEEIGASWRRHFGKVFPCMAVIGVSELVEREAIVEIEATAVVPIEAE
ncbi:enamine deaminase RidA [Erythrobacter sp. KY5]|uniref:RidA family protein n=1 Tax=Erythrobacter sp. KY5 TaxID=2011159 RepID=UPI000DBF04B1|nr:RidA family protein [Erythrobacter sp. KY5]AWW74396.1 enamine deaminase RidA [Erythrobacter sp. KY5]